MGELLKTSRFINLIKVKRIFNLSYDLLDDNILQTSINKVLKLY